MDLSPRLVQNYRLPCTTSVENQRLETCPGSLFLELPDKLIEVLCPFLLRVSRARSAGSVSPGTGHQNITKDEQASPGSAPVIVLVLTFL
jgi:hypothetical protein